MEGFIRVLFLGSLAFSGSGRRASYLYTALSPPMVQPERLRV